MQAQALLDGFQADRKRITAACAAMANTELAALDRKRVLSLDAFLDLQRQHREQVCQPIFQRMNVCAQSACCMPPRVGSGRQCTA